MKIYCKVYSFNTDTIETLDTMQDNNQYCSHLREICLRKSYGYRDFERYELICILTECIQISYCVLCAKGDFVHS